MKKIIVAVILLFGVSIFSDNLAFATDDNIEFSFTVKARHANSYSESRYRQTSSADNPWKVNFAYSEEGKGTITTFWLSEFNGDYYVQQVSDTYNVKQGTEKYYSAWYNASKKYVSLSAENNNYSESTYYITGYWDEETW